MKNIYSNIFSFNKKNLNKCLLILKKGELVGVPTETVYGLAGNAYNKDSIKKIYKMKRRPNLNPLIIHYFNYKDAKKDVVLNKSFFKLFEKFCPGPITFILKKRNTSKISSRATSNLKTVAIRFPNHKIVRLILKNLEFPLAIPSANMSSRVSPVNAEDVSEEFKRKIKFILNGGVSKIGIESTVIDLTSKPKILRPGIIEPSLIRKALNRKIRIVNKKTKINSPGLLEKHYSPGIPVIINQKKIIDKQAFITFGKKFKTKNNHFNLSKTSNLKEAASKLYRTLRKIKKLGFKKIYVTKIPNIGIGIAINDRLKKASR